MTWVFNNMNKEKGQTLVEIIAAIGVVIILVTGLLVGAIASLKSVQFGKAKSVALHYAQEAMENARNIRNNNWSDFFAYGSPSGKTWCLNKNGTWSQGGPCPINIDGVYTRTVTFTWQDPTMNVDVTVSWQGGQYQVNLSTYFTQWK